HRGQLTRAAEFLRCQRSYLSRVILEDIHLTPDHAYKLAKFWGLPSAENEYFQKLVEWERAGDHEYRSHLQMQLNELKSRHDNIQERTKRGHLTAAENQVSYFPAWIWSAIHFLTSIPEFQSVEAISHRLGLRSDQTKKYLNALLA